MGYLSYYYIINKDIKEVLNNGLLDSYNLNKSKFINNIDKLDKHTMDIVEVENKTLIVLSYNSKLLVQVKYKEISDLFSKTLKTNIQSGSISRVKCTKKQLCVLLDLIYISEMNTINLMKEYTLKDELTVLKNRIETLLNSI